MNNESALQKIIPSNKIKELPISANTYNIGQNITENIILI